MKRLPIGALSLFVAACSAQQPVSNNSGVTTDRRSSAQATPAASPPADAPFGIAFGTDISRLGGVAPLDRPGRYLVTTPPRPHPDFDSVAVTAFPETGVCAIRGIGHPITGDATGASIRALIDSTARTLEGKYGAGTRIDECDAGEIQCESQFWMMTLQDGARTYGYRWVTPSAAMRRERIADIVITASADSMTTSSALIEFRSLNRRDCEAAQSRVSASAF
jgi:hypothetical protein